MNKLLISGLLLSTLTVGINASSSNYNTGMKLVKLKKYEKALEYFQKDDTDQSLYVAGSLLAYKVKNKDFKKALEYYTRACEKGHYFACGARGNIVDDFMEKSDLINEAYTTFPQYAMDKDFFDPNKFNRTKAVSYMKRAKKAYTIDLARHMHSRKDSSIHSFDKIEDLSYTFFEDKKIKNNQDNTILDKVKTFDSTIDGAYKTDKEIISFNPFEKLPVPKTYILTKKGRVVGTYSKLEKQFNHEEELISKTKFLKNSILPWGDTIYYDIARDNLKDTTQLVTNYQIDEKTFNDMNFEDMYNYSTPEVSVGKKTPIQTLFEEKTVQLLTDEIKSFRVILGIKDRINYKEIIKGKLRDRGNDFYEVYRYTKDSNGEIKYTIELIELDTFALENIK